MQPSKMRLKLLQHFKDKIGSTGVLFLQKTDSKGIFTLQFSYNFLIIGKFGFMEMVLIIILSFCVFFLPFLSDFSLYFFPSFFETKIE